jgi:hypothetical protein
MRIQIQNADPDSECGSGFRIRNRIPNAYPESECGIRSRIEAQIVTVKEKDRKVNENEEMLCEVKG